MAFDSHYSLEPTTSEDVQPVMLNQPSDAPPALGPASAAVEIQIFRQAWRYRHDNRPSTVAQAIRGWLARQSGRSDRHLLESMAHAVEALTAHCDRLSEHLAVQEAVTEEISASYGDEITRLRAQVLHLQRLLEGDHDA